MKKLSAVIVVALSQVFAVSAFANDASSTYSINFTETSPVIDGKGTDAVWDNANTLTQFTFPWRSKVAPATEFSALWDADAIYFRYRITDSNTVIGTDPKRAILDSDRAEIFLAKDKELSVYYTMEIDAKARIFSAEASYDQTKRKIGSIDKTWKWPGLVVHTSTYENGYTVEGKLPLATITQLGLWQNVDKSELLCALMRAEFTTKSDGSLDMGWMTWIDPNTPKPNFHNPSTFGKCVLEK